LLDHAQFDAIIGQVSYVITGEGRLDSQSLAGKTPIGVARRARLHRVKTIAIVGALAVAETDLRQAGLWAALPILIEPMSLAESIAHSADLIERAALRLGHLLSDR
jgi:glycerate kinase